MKKLFSGIITFGLIAPLFVFAQTTNITVKDNIIRQTIALLVQEVNQLEAQLQALQNQNNVGQIGTAASTTNTNTNQADVVQFVTPTYTGCEPVPTTNLTFNEPYYQFSPSYGQQKTDQWETIVYIPYNLTNIYDYNSPTDYWIAYGTSTDNLNSTTTEDVTSTNFLNGAHYFEGQFQIQNVIEGIPYYYRMIFWNATSGIEMNPATNTAPCTFTAPFRIGS